MRESLAFCCDAGLKVDWSEDDEKLGNIISVPSEIYIKGCVQDVDDGLAVSKSEKIDTNALFYGESLCSKCSLPCSGLRKLATQLLSRLLRVEVGRESVRSKAPKTLLVSLDRSAPRI